jgi:S1-C subfamily serine protease
MALSSKTKQLILGVVVLCVISGLIGGAVAYRWFNQPAQSVITSGATVTKDSVALAEVIKQVSPSVVSIIASNESAGSGIVLSSDGLIMTNKHVVENQRVAYSVVMSDGKEYQSARVIALDPYNDVAFIKIDAKGLKPAKLSDSTNYVVGQRVVAIGNALGQFQNTATEGIVSGYGRSIQAGDGSGNTETLTNLIQTDAAINPGNSGGPLVTTAGEVIGMNTATAGDAQNIGFAIPVSEIKNQIQSVQQTGKIVRPYLGVRYVPLTPQLAQRNDLSVDYGAYLTSVVQDSPADKAGLREDDIITKINNDELGKNNSLQSLLAKYQVGDEVTITYVRGGKTQTVKIKLEQAPTS